ncbi:MAG: tripartite tricarboxylate transporter substrate binding protein [Betaproteobacteria bacterium]|nr:tripartite tricarboxylate transporter substrate binding protein [Betaproteobacteria bacterium]
MKAISIAARIVVLALSATPLAAWSQAFPSKPIRIVVPYAPGGVDLSIRMMQKAMSDELGQPVVVENRPGANGTIGAEHVARSAPDGYTLLAAVGSNLIAGPLLASKPPFDPIRDFTPITMVFGTAFTLVVKTSLPVTSVAELIEFAKRNPGKLSYASTGVGSLGHIDGENLKLITGIDMVHIAYKGFGPMVQALLAQEIDIGWISTQSISPLVSSGKARPIAMNLGKRPANFPNIPDLSEVVPGFRAIPTFVGVLGPAGLPRPVLMRLNAAAVKAIHSPEVRSKLDEAGDVLGNSPEEFSAILAAGIDTASKAIRALRANGVKFD